MKIRKVNLLDTEKITKIKIAAVVVTVSLLISILFMSYIVYQQGRYALIWVPLSVLCWMAAICLYQQYLVKILKANNKKINEAQFQQLTQLANEIHKVHKMHKMLGNVVAHQIRNPLNNLSSSIYLLKDLISDKNPNIEKHIKDIESELNRVKKIINNFLNFSRPSKGMMEEDVNLIINQTLELVRETISSQGITIKTQFNPNLPKMTIDVDQIKEVFLNIVLNAQEAMSKGGCLTVTTNLNKDYVQIAFADTGVGIPEENIEEVFDPYYTTKKKGMGLGLSIAQRVIEDHHGSIGIESKVGVGTTVKITLPINKRGEV